MDMKDICLQMEEGNLNWSSDRSRIQTSNNNPTPDIPSFYTRLTQNLSRSQTPSVALGRAQEEGSRLIRDNISSVISELGPLMEPARQRENASLNLRSWMKKQQDIADTRRQLERSVSQSAVPTTTESTVIDFGDGHESTTPPPQANVQPVRNGSVQQQQQPNNSSVNSSVNSSEDTNNDSQVNEQQVNNPVEVQNPNPSTNETNTVPVTTGSNTGNVPLAELNPDAEYVIALLQKYFPFILILLGKAIYDHRAGILIFVGLLITFTHADSVVKREIARQSRRSLVSLFILFVNLLFCICFVYYVFKEEHLYKCLIFIPPYSQPLTLFELVWVVGITDFILKFITIQIKAGVACLPAMVLPYSTRGKWYLFVESVSQLYRGLVPIQPWLYYLLECYQGPDKVIGVFLSAAYMVSKGTDLVVKVRFFRAAFWKLLQKVNLGVSPSKEQLDTAGSHCPICHDDYETPVLLNCRHVFCEACVTTWFDREQTCPLCRSKVADDPAWKDGATTFFAQLY